MATKTNATKVQHRGNCQLCGNDQAVLKSGLMSKHGYTVDNGWFNGVCRGADYTPMQVSRKVTDITVADIRKQVIQLRSRAGDLKAGRVLPEKAAIGRERGPKGFFEDVMGPYEQANAYEQRAAVERAFYDCAHRAEAGTRFAEHLETTANAVHGQPLRVVEVPSNVPKIHARGRSFAPACKWAISGRTNYITTDDPAKLTCDKCKAIVAAKAAKAAAGGAS